MQKHPCRTWCSLVWYGFSKCNFLCVGQLTTQQLLYSSFLFLFWLLGINQLGSTWLFIARILYFSSWPKIKVLHMPKINVLHWPKIKVLHIIVAVMMSSYTHMVLCREKRTKWHVANSIFQDFGSITLSSASAAECWKWCWILDWTVMYEGKIYASNMIE